MSDCVSQLGAAQSDAAQHLDRDALESHQFGRLLQLLGPVLDSNPFYRQQLNAAGVKRPEDLASLDDFRRLPLTTRADFSADQVQHPPYGTNLTYPAERYTRIHQTTGTTGQRLRWLDTAESWDWWGRCWAQVYQGAGIGADDRIFFAFSFGPFIGFWSGHEGANHIGALIVPGGGMSSEQRLDAIVENQITALVCTPTYALHLGEVARARGLDLAACSVRTTVHAGEPGANLPATRELIEKTWGARCFDHAGATEVGAWGFDCQQQSGLHLNEGEFICEVIDPTSGAPADEGELVITNLGRTGMPVIRYRTGDQVALNHASCDCGRTFNRLKGGVIGRVDDALIIRGIVVYPSAIENVVRQFPAITEFAVDIQRRQALDELEVRLELVGDTDGIADQVAQALSHRLGLRAQVAVTGPNTLPRFELKARRFTDHRSNT